jgi:protein-S-isoprenylcysteine O-methyltransferase Ste14
MKPTRNALLGSAVGSVLFLGLAIWGRGGFAEFFSVPALVAVAIATLALMVAGILSPANLSSGEREDRRNRWVLAAFSVIGLVLAYFPAYTDRIGFRTLDGGGVRWLGVGLYVVGGVIRLWPVFVMKNQFSGLVAIQPGHRLVTTGIYSMVRNPSYLGLLINAVGWGLAFRSVVGVLLALLNVLPLVARMHSEERLLEAHFGDEYRAYAARTARLIPGIY